MTLRMSSSAAARPVNKEIAELVALLNDAGQALRRCFVSSPDRLARTIALAFDRLWALYEKAAAILTLGRVAAMRAREVVRQLASALLAALVHLRHSVHPDQRRRVHVDPSLDVGPSPGHRVAASPLQPTAPPGPSAALHSVGELAAAA